MSKEPSGLCGNSNTWRHKGERIDVPRLLQLIEENGGPDGLDLHGAGLFGLDARPEALRPYVDQYSNQHGPDAWPPWLSARAWGVTSIDLSAGHLEQADLFGAHLPNAFMANAHLENAMLVDAHMENANLQEALLENADLVGAHLENATLFDAHLENANLRGTHLENARLLDAHLENVDLLAAHMENANFGGARLYRTFWYGSYLDRTRIRRESLGDAIGDELSAKGRATPWSSFHYAREAYLALKTNFDSIGRYDDATWAYVKEQQMEKAMYFPTTAGHRWIRRSVRRGHRRWLKSRPGRVGRFVRGSILGRLQWAWLHLLLFVGLRPADFKRAVAKLAEDDAEQERIDHPRWLRNWGYELLTGYGERPFRPVIWAAVVVLLFAAIYAAAGNIASGDVGALQGQPTHSPITALVHSISAFATIGFNTLEPQGWGARLLTALEAMFGIGLFALFVFTLGNRMRRS